MFTNIKKGVTINLRNGGAKMEKKTYNFGEKTKEYSAKDGTEIPVWKTPKYESAKQAVIKMLESNEYKDILDESDFWILMNRTKTGKMAYTGLIISHNGCLKINDTLPEELKFNPKCLTWRITDYKNSLIFIYDSSVAIDYRSGEEDKQRIFEIGEVNEKNCLNDYPFAMALKRCMDRVILKNSKLAYSGVYSDSEAEEFKEPFEEKPTIPATEKQLERIKDLYSKDVENLQQLLAVLGKKKINELTIEEASHLIKTKGE